MTRTKYPIPHTGHTFHYWRVIYVPRPLIKILCQCRCLQIAEVSFHHLMTEGTQGCRRCRHGKRSHEQNLNYQTSRLYSVWNSMIQRCQNPRSPAWKYYGGRGITVCERWKRFQTFFEDMGEKPTPQSTLERKDNNKGYSADNCCWATRAEQGRNTRKTIFLTYNGKTQMIHEWAQETGVPEGTMRSRRYRHPLWSVEQLLAPIHPRWAARASRSA